jgi:hypothetical protein
MADAPATKKKKGSGKKFLGLGAMTWGIVGVGAVGLWYFIRKYEADKTAAAATGTTDGQTTPGSSTGTTTAALPTTLSAWYNDVLAALTTGTYTSSDLLNDLNSWFSGQCVSAQGYTAIGQAVSEFGVPPGYSTTPTLSVCSGSTTAPSPGTTTTGSGAISANSASGTGTSDNPFTLIPAASSTAANALASTANDLSQTVFVNSPGYGTYAVEPGQTIAEAAGVAIAPVVAQEVATQQAAQKAAGLPSGTLTSAQINPALDADLAAAGIPQKT